QQAWTFSGPSEKPADTSSRKVEGFYLGCRWIASPKDIPVPEKVLKRIERLRGGPMIESEKDIQILISEWQKGEFRRLKEQILISTSGENGVTKGYQIASQGECLRDCPVHLCPCEYHQCNVCGLNVCCCAAVIDPSQCPCSGWDCCVQYVCSNGDSYSHCYKCG
ncbi:MAG: hypothetical protein V2G43_07670, partial [bacterium JZ-2024 1]